MSRVNVLINAANLRHGGGVQVAASFLDEAAGLASSGENPFPWLAGATVWASPEVLANVAHDTPSILDVQERSTTLDRAGRREGPFAASFTVFGPEYVPYRSAHRIVGFADVTSLFPEFLAPSRGRAHVKQLVRLKASRASFRRADALVVEAEHISRALQQRWRIPARKISVVPNTYNSMFRRQEDWAPAPAIQATPGTHDLLYVTRAYPHKNLSVLGEVALEAAKIGCSIRFVLTLTEREWAALPSLTREHSVNVGPVSVAQLPELYSTCDAAFFPSLFEAFSVTPLEALISGTPLVASDRDFVSEVVGEYAHYADPHDPKDLARAAAQAVRNGRDDVVARAKEFAIGWPDARSRAISYLEALDRAISGR